MDAATLEPSVKHPDRFFIGGTWVKPSSPATITVKNSGTEEPYLRVAAAQAADIDRAVAAARTAFDTGPWRRMTHAVRAADMRAIARELVAHNAELARIWTTESGVLHANAKRGSAAVGDTWESYAALADTFRFEERREPTPGIAKVGILVREPVGVVAAIIPWNHPAGLAAHKCAPALLAGCTVILKASPEAPGAAYLLAQVCEKIGLPPGVLNVVTADREASEHLVRHPEVDKVTFTGSTAAGRRIASICGERIARCTLELGGKSAAIVYDDYDVGKVADVLAANTPRLTGQVCAALTRVIVSRSRHDELVDALSAAFAAIKVGDPFKAETQMGPLASEIQRTRVEDYIAAGKAEGATLATGGGRPAHLNRGYFVEPTVFGNVDNNSTIAREEIFGPVVSVIAADDEAQAVQIANDTIFGLNAAIFTNDLERAYAAAREIRSGTVGHNSFRTDFGIAFGGFKQSGVGREGGAEGPFEFSSGKPKPILMDEMPANSSAH